MGQCMHTPSMFVLTITTSFIYCGSLAGFYLPGGGGGGGGGLPIHTLLEFSNVLPILNLNQIYNAQAKNLSSYRY